MPTSDFKDFYLVSVCASNKWQGLHGRYLYYHPAPDLESALELATMWWRQLLTNLGIPEQEIGHSGVGTLASTNSEFIYVPSQEYYCAGDVAIKLEKCLLVATADQESSFYLLKESNKKLPTTPVHRGVAGITEYPDLHSTPYFWHGGNITHLVDDGIKVGAAFITSRQNTYINPLIEYEDLLHWEISDTPEKLATRWYKGHVLSINRQLHLAPHSHLRSDILVSRTGNQIYGLANKYSICAGPVTYRWCQATILTNELGEEFLRLPSFHNYIIPKFSSNFIREIYKEYL